MRKVLVAIIAAWALMIFFTAGVVRADDQIQVCPSDADSQACTSASGIQDAIDKAAANSVVRLKAGVYNESNIIIRKNITILGAGPGKTIIQPGKSPCVKEERVFQIIGVKVRMEGLTIRYGCATNATGEAEGGGIWAAGALTLKHVVVQQNSAVLNTTTPASEPPHTAAGGGIYNGGSLRIENSSVISNHVVADIDIGNAFGGGIYNNTTASIVNSTFSGNEAAGERGVNSRYEGGGIYSFGDMDMTFGTVATNVAYQEAGGIKCEGVCTFANSLVVNNSSLAGGAPSDCVVVPPNSTSATGEPSAEAPAGEKCDIKYFTTGIRLAKLDMKSHLPVQRALPASVSIDSPFCRPTIARIPRDQMGAERMQGAGCDLGAVEYSFSFMPHVQALPDMPDLEITSITVSPPPGEITTDSRVIISVAIKNSGNAAVMVPFWVNLYINPIKPPPNQAGTTWRALCRSAGCLQDRGIMFTSPASLPFDPNSNTFTLSSDMSEGNPFVYRRLTTWDERLPEGEVELWAYIDSYSSDENPSGLILERIETNNRFGPIRLTVKRGMLATADDQPIFPAAVEDLPPAEPPSISQP